MTDHLFSDSLIDNGSQAIVHANDCVMCRDKLFEAVFMKTTLIPSVALAWITGALVPIVALFLIGPVAFLLIIPLVKCLLVYTKRRTTNNHKLRESVLAASLSFERYVRRILSAQETYQTHVSGEFKVVLREAADEIEGARVTQAREVVQHSTPRALPRPALVRDPQPHDDLPVIIATLCDPPQDVVRQKEQVVDKYIQRDTLGVRLDLSL